MTNRDTVLEDLKALAAYDFIIDRGERIDAARCENVTWREIAAVLGMTENGVHKAYSAYEARGAKLDK